MISLRCFMHWVQLTFQYESFGMCLWFFFLFLPTNLHCWCCFSFFFFNWRIMFTKLFSFCYTTWILFYFIYLFLCWSLFIFIYLFIFYFAILYWFCHSSTWIRHGCTNVPHPEPPSHLPPHTIPLGHPSAPALSILYHALNLDWQFS